MALRVIEEYLRIQRSLISTIGDLSRIIVLLGENELDLSRTLKEKWRILEEVSARTIYRRLPGVPQESRGIIIAALKEMKAVVLRALGESRMKPARLIYRIAVPDDLEISSELPRG